MKIWERLSVVKLLLHVQFLPQIGDLKSLILNKDGLNFPGIFYHKDLAFVTFKAKKILDSWKNHSEWLYLLWCSIAIVNNLEKPVDSNLLVILAIFGWKLSLILLRPLFLYYHLSEQFFYVLIFQYFFLLLL